MVGIGYAYIRRCVGCNVCDNVVIYFAVVRIKPKAYFYVWVEQFKVAYGLLVYPCLVLIGIVLGPEGKLILPRSIELLRHYERIHAAGAVARRERAAERNERYYKAYGFYCAAHPFNPPLDTPSIIFFLKIRNSAMSGTDIATTAAIIAGMLSRPKPPSRMACMPPETRK